MTPQQELAALRRMAELEAKAAGGVPSQPLPGLGRNAGPDPRIEQMARENFVRRNQPASPVANFVSGNVRGVADTGIGILQMLSRGAQTNQEPYQFADVPAGVDPTAVADGLAGLAAQSRANDPGAETFAGKLGQFTGGMIATAPMAALSVPAKGAPLLSSLGRAGAGGGAVAATQPVAGGDFASQKAAQIAGGIGFGVAIPAALRSAMAVSERTFGPNILAQLANAGNARANRKPFAQEGEDLADRTGVRMTPGQVSGSKIQTGLENMSRQSFFSADKAFEADQKVAEDAVRYVNRIMDNVSRNPASAAVIGTQVQAVTRGAVAKIATKREEVAAAQYGAIDKALNGRAFVTPTNAMREADAIIAEYGSVAGPEAARIVRQAEALKAQLAGKKAYTFTEAQKSRSYYGRGARGAANVFDEVNPDINRRIATRIFKAFSDDIEASADNLAGRGPGLVPAGTVGLSDAIKQANANYRRYSQAIDGVKAHPISRLFGDEVSIDDVVRMDKIAPETVIQRMGQMQPTEIRMVRDYLRSEAPESWQQYKRLLIENALDAAQTLPTSMGQNTLPFNASLFIRTLGGDKPDKVKKLHAVFDADELREIDDAFAVARRMGDRFGYNGSNTGPYREVMGLLDSIKQRSFQAAASTGGEVMGLRKVANVMLNADGRRALIQLSKLPPQSRQAASLAGVLAALASGQGASDGDYGNGAGRPQ